MIRVKFFSKVQKYLRLRKQSGLCIFPNVLPFFIHYFINITFFCISLGDPTPNVPFPNSRSPSRGGSGDHDAPPTPPAPCIPSAPPGASRGLSTFDYPSYMARLLATEYSTPLSSPGGSSVEASPTTRRKVCPVCRQIWSYTIKTTRNSPLSPNLSFFTPQCTCDLTEFPENSQTAWVNALIGRIFWDFLREKHWVDAVSHKIQKKLSKIRVRRIFIKT